MARRRLSSISDSSSSGTAARTARGRYMKVHEPPRPSDVLAVGDVVTVRILRIDTDRRRIGLSLKRAPQWVEIELSAVEERAARDVTSLTKDATEIQGQPQVAIAVDSQDSTESSLTPGATAASDTLTTPDLSGGESKIRVEEFTSLAAMA